MSRTDPTAPSNSPMRSRFPVEQRRAEILRIGARLFQLRGYTGVSIDDIGTALGVTGPAVYRYVDSKQGLLSEIAIGMFDLLIDDAERVVARELVAQDTLEHLITSTTALCLKHPAGVIVCLRHLWNLDEEHHLPVLESWQTLLDLWTPVLSAARPGLRRDDAGVYVRAGVGLLAGAARSTSNVPRTRLVEITSSMLRAMLNAHPAPDSDSRDEAEVPGNGGWQRSSRREQLLSAAISRFRTQGFRGVSMAQIAQEVGVSASAAYRHFKNKDDILATGIDRAGERMTMGLDQALNGATSAHEALDRLLRNYIRISLDNRDLVAVSTSEYHHLPDEFKQRHRKRKQLLNDEWAHCMATTHPQLSRNEAIAVVNGVIGMITETIRSASLRRRPRLGDDLYRIAHASLVID